MADPIIRTEDLGLTGNGDRLLGSISIELERNTILGIIGPTGSGKTSFLRVINRLIEFDHGYRVSGRVYFEERDIYQPEVDLAWLRRQIGMVFALPVPLPMSIYDNLAFGPRLNGIRKRAELDELVENSLRSAYLWGEVKDRLELPALKLSGGQQQRLCLARQSWSNCSRTQAWK